MGEVSDTLVRLVREAVQRDDVEVPLSRPPDSAMGDYAVPCFRLARQVGMAPAPLAEQLRDRLRERDLAALGIARVEAQGPYLNIHLAKGDRAARVIGAILAAGAGYGARGAGAGKRALVEHTSINPNAPPHLGRARNAWIGDTLVRLLRFEGYALQARFFVNDVGRQIALLVAAVGDRRPDFHELLEIYVAANRRLAQEPALEQEVTRLLERLESGDRGTRAAFRRVVDISVRGMRELFGDAGVRYDRFDYESDYLTPERHAQLVAQLRATGKLFEDEHGRLALDLEGFKLPSRNPVLVITRGNKTSLYVLRDLAYTLDKMDAAADLNLVVQARIRSCTTASSRRRWRCSARPPPPRCITVTCCSARAPCRRARATWCCWSSSSPRPNARRAPSWRRAATRPTRRWPRRSRTAR